MQLSLEIINDEVKSQYTVTRLNRDNLKDLAKLYREVYNSIQPDEYFFKKYDTAYTGVEHVGFVAYNHNQLPVAYYGVIPCFIEYKNKMILAAQSADTMTHPQHRYKGMFVDLSNKTFELCRQLNIRLVFGFPNQNSYHGAVNKLGWKMTETLDCFTITVKSLPLVSLSRRFSFFERLYKKYTRFILDKESVSLKGVASSVLADGYAAVCRSYEYLQYKTYNNTIVIREGNSTIWLSIKHSLLIGDIAGVNETNFNAVISKIKRLAKKLGVKQVRFHCSPGTHLHELFARSYKAMPSFPSLFQDFGSSISPEKIKFIQADMDIF